MTRKPRSRVRILTYRTCISYQDLGYNVSLQPVRRSVFYKLRKYMIFLMVGTQFQKRKAFFKSWNNTLYNSRSEWQAFSDGRPGANPLLRSCSSGSITLCRGYNFGEISAAAWKSYHRPAEYPQSFLFVQKSYNCDRVRRARDQRGQTTKTYKRLFKGIDGKHYYGTFKASVP